MTLELQEFQAIRQRRALSEPIGFAVNPGTVVVLVGPNGSGKSSLLSAIAHTGVASRGTVHFDRVDLRRQSPRKRAAVLSFLAQDTRGADDMTVRQLIGVGIAANSAPLSRAADRVGTAMETAEVSHLADRRLGTLSGGQRQSAQLARVIAQDTPLVLLDEPASAMDIAHRIALERIVRTLASHGRTVVVAVHDLDFAFAVADEALLLTGDGRWHFGPPGTTLAPHMLNLAYGVAVTHFSTPTGRTIVVPAGN